MEGQMSRSIDFLTDVRGQATRSPELTYQIRTSFEDVGICPEEWDKFMEDVRADIYLSYDWCRVWWKYYGAGLELAIFVFRAGEELVGLVPVTIDSVGIGSFSCTTARLLGSNVSPKITHPPVISEYSTRIFRLMIEEILVTRKSHVFVLGPISDEYTSLEQLREACLQSDQWRLVRETSNGPNTVFLLPSSFEAYLQNLSGNERQKYKKTLRWLKNEVDVNLDLIQDPEQVPFEFDRFRRMHDLQWQSEGFLGHFGSWPHAYPFHLELALVQATRGRLRLFRLGADKDPLIYQYAYCFRGRYYHRMTARKIGDTWERFRLGRLGQIAIIEKAISENMTTIEAGLGHYEYKLQLGGKEFESRTLSVVANNVGAVTRYKVLKSLSNVVEVVYQKIWLRRLAPKLRRKPHPLSMAYIRTKV